MKCEACTEGRHQDCGMQTWCDCDCEGYSLDGAYADAQIDDSPSVIGTDLHRQMPTEADRREAYKRLYVGRMVARGIDREDAEACFEAGEVDYEVDPESAADDELSYWDADE